MKKIKDISTTPPKKFSKEATNAKTEKFINIIHDEQHKLYAESKKSLLIVLQGMDASGKDGVTRQIFSSVNPAGVTVRNFKKPSELEASHDFLWRIHSEMPQKGMIKIFNRSHYEDILVPYVNGDLNKEELNHRYEIINEFEKHLQREGTVILKFYLHISEKEQKIRLEERITNKLKQWKYDPMDFKTAKSWPKYRKIYQHIFNECNDVKWEIIPADKNWYKEYLVAKKVAETLMQMKLAFPGINKILRKKLIDPADVSALPQIKALLKREKMK